MNQIPYELIKCDDYDKITKSCNCNKQYIDKESNELKWICKCDTKALKQETK